MAVARDKMRPGVVMKEANQAVIDFYKKALRTAKLIRDDSEVSKYYYHGVSIPWDWTPTTPVTARSTNRAW